MDPALQARDRLPPSPPARVTARASRSSGSFCDRDGSCTVSTCGSSGSLLVEFEPASDDQSPADELGYRLRFVAGFVPPELDAALAEVEVGVGLVRFELPFDPVPELDATFELIAVDRAGNHSAASDSFRAAFDGCTSLLVMDGCAEDRRDVVRCADGTCYQAAEQGCSFAPAHRSGASALAWLLSAVAVTLGLRRRVAGYRHH